MKDELPDQNESEKSKGLSGNSVLLCVACGDFAVAKLQMTTHQCELCNTCLAENEQKANEVNNHEMANFGGAYGLVTYEVLPI